MNKALRIHLVSDPSDPELVSLIAKSDEYLSARYPPESNHAESIEVLTGSAAALFVGYTNGTLAACGALKFIGTDSPYAEIKRLFVAEQYRGHGFATAMMRHLEAHALAQGIRLVRLETGTRQPEALGLYRKLGYTDRGPFGRYGNDPLSVFMEKRLSG